MNTRGASWAGWTDEIFEETKALYMSGISCSKIAERLKIPSRNAVIGKMARMGVKRPGAPSRPKGMAVKREILRDNPRPLPPPVIYEPPPPLGLTIMELRWPAESHKATCRWPIGGTGVEMKFCGLDCGNIYCDEHVKAAYQPMTEAQKRATARSVIWAAR